MSTAAGFIEAAWTMTRVRRFAAADDLFVRALALQPGAVGALGGRAVALNGLGHHAMAMEMAKSAIAADPSNSWAWYIMGWVHSRSARWIAALNCFDKAIELNPLNESALAERASCRYAIKHFRHAQRDAREAARLAPQNPDPMNTLGLALFYGGQQSEGFDVLVRCRQSHPGSAAAHANIGHCLRTQERYKEATASFERALRLRPDEDSWIEPMLACRRRAVWWIRIIESPKGESFLPAAWLVASLLALFAALNGVESKVSSAAEAFIWVAAATLLLAFAGLMDYNPLVTQFVGCADQVLRRMTPPATRAAGLAMAQLCALGTALGLLGFLLGVPGVAWLAIPCWALSLAAGATQFQRAKRATWQVVLAIAALAWFGKGVMIPETRLWTLLGAVAAIAFGNHLLRLRRTMMQPLGSLPSA